MMIEQTKTQGTQRTSQETCPNQSYSIAISFTQNDVPFACVLIYSILSCAAPGKIFVFHLLYDKLTAEQITQLQSTIDGFQNAQLKFIPVLEHLKDVFADEDMVIPDVKGYSLLAPYVIESEYTLLCLDCHCMAMKDITMLFQVDLQGKAIAAVQDLEVLGAYRNPGNLARYYLDINLRLETPENYFSSDVLLVFPHRCRDIYSLQQIKELYESQPWKNGGQDLWNILMQGNVFLLPPEWNCIDILKSRAIANIPQDRLAPAMRAQAAPALIRFSRSNVFHSEFTPFFWQYARQTTFYESLLSMLFQDRSRAYTKKSIVAFDRRIKERAAQQKKRRKKQPRRPIIGWSPYLEEKYNIKGPAVPLRGLQIIEFDILKEFDVFCKENGLRYYLAGGTLLGAVRHKGFIPWDDDIDLLMPRPDYMRFLKITNGNLANYEVRSIYNCPRKHICHIARIVDPRYMGKISKKMYGVPYFSPPWIDIFPMDGLPTDERESERHFAKVKRLRDLLARAWKPVWMIGGGKLRKILKSIMYWPLKLYGYNRIMKKIERLTMRYPYDECEYVGAVGCGQGEVERMPREMVFGDTIQMEFEGAEFPSPAGYDYYLKSLYNNYLVLPSGAKRKNHVERIWLIDEGEK